MFLIDQKETFSPGTFLMNIRAADIASAAQPGQFVMVRLKEGGERIPLTVADFDRNRGTITLVVKVVGKTTEEMSRLNAGGEILDVVGPLGAPTHLEPHGHVVLVGGGLGVAPLFPIIRGFREAGCRITTVIGFRSVSEIFWKERFQDLSHRLVLMTEDGTAGRRGTVIDGLKPLLTGGEPIDLLMTVGPIGMMQAVAEATRSYQIPTFASMNPIMVDGIGMCGSCRVKVGDRVLFACVDGPDMDAHRVDFEELKIRQKRFQNEEREALLQYREECALKKQGVFPE